MSLAETAIEAGSIGSAGSLAVRQRHNGPAFDDELSGETLKIFQNSESFLNIVLQILNLVKTTIQMHH